MYPAMKGDLPIDNKMLILLSLVLRIIVQVSLNWLFFISQKYLEINDISR